MAGAVPGFRGFEHVSITVADLDEACELFVGVLGCEPFYDLQPTLERHGSGFGAYANVDVPRRTVRGCGSCARRT